MPIKTTSPRKTKTVSSDSVPDVATPVASTPPISFSPLTDTVSAIDSLDSLLASAKNQLQNFQKSIIDTYESWTKEEHVHIQETQRRDQEIERVRQREQEEYDYRKQMKLRQDEDEATAKRQYFDQEIVARQSQLDADQKELATLRAQASNFTTEIDKAVKNGQQQITTSLNNLFQNESKTTALENKAAVDLLNLKIVNLEAENSRLNKEVELLKRSLDTAATQVKDIAVKVIEGRPASTVTTGSTTS